MRQIFLICLCVFSAFSTASPIPSFFNGRYLPWKLGTCKNFSIKGLDAQKFFTGHWYEQKSFGNYLFQADGICTATEFEVKGKEVKVLYYQYEPMIQKYIYFTGKSDLSSLLASSFSLTFDYFAGLGHITIPITVVDTDYENYAIFYSCEEAFGFKAEMSWIATRQRGNTSYDSTIKKVINNSGLDYYEYLPQKTTDCLGDEPHL